MTEKKTLNEEDLTKVAGGEQHYGSKWGKTFYYADVMTDQYHLMIGTAYCIFKAGARFQDFGICEAVWEESATCGTNRKARFKNILDGDREFEIYVDQDKDGYQCFECYKMV